MHHKSLTVSVTVHTKSTNVRNSIWKHYTIKCGILPSMMIEKINKSKRFANCVHHSSHVYCQLKDWANMTIIKTCRRQCTILNWAIASATTKYIIARIGVSTHSRVHRTCSLRFVFALTNTHNFQFHWNECMQQDEESAHSIQTSAARVLVVCVREK